jgi:hypothetical protein
MKLLQFAALLLLVALVGSVPALGASAAGSAFYMLGSTKVELHNYHKGGAGGFTFFAPHSNETTALSAAKAVVGKSGGDVFWLTHGDGARNITFKIGKQAYTVDPNRMFSSQGIRLSLKPYSEDAAQEVKGLAAFVIGKIWNANSPPIVGIHNNTNGNLSVVSYTSGANRAEAKQTYAAKGQDPDDFFFVTTSAAFSVLKNKGFNVVLQAWPIKDDGSLSVYCEQRGRPYINVEAQTGHASQQIAMLKAATGT